MIPSLLTGKQKFATFKIAEGTGIEPVRPAGHAIIGRLLHLEANPPAPAVGRGILYSALRSAHDSPFSECWQHFVRLIGL